MIVAKGVDENKHPNSGTKALKGSFRSEQGLPSSKNGKGKDGDGQRTYSWLLTPSAKTPAQAMRLHPSAKESQMPPLVPQGFANPMEWVGVRRGMVLDQSGLTPFPGSFTFDSSEIGKSIVPPRKISPVPLSMLATMAQPDSPSKRNKLAGAAAAAAAAGAATAATAATAAGMKTDNPKTPSRYPPHT